MIDTLTPGDRLICQRNDYIPERVGTVVELEKVGKSFANARIVTDPTDRLQTGGGYRLSLPTRKRDVIEDSDVAFSYTIDRANEDGERAVVTWERASA